MEEPKNLRAEYGLREDYDSRTFTEFRDRFMTWEELRDRSYNCC